MVCRVNFFTLFALKMSSSYGKNILFSRPVGKFRNYNKYIFIMKSVVLI